MSWVYTKDELPPEGKYVIAKHSRGTWRDSSDQKNVNTVVVKLVKGLSKEDRENLPDSDPRKKVYHSWDEGSNNKKSYCWKPFGSDTFFGQDIICWTDIPDSTDDMNYIHENKVPESEKKVWAELADQEASMLMFGKNFKKED